MTHSDDQIELTNVQRYSIKVADRLRTYLAAAGKAALWTDERLENLLMNDHNTSWKAIAEGRAGISSLTMHVLSENTGVNKHWLTTGDADPWEVHIHSCGYVQAG